MSLKEKKLGAFGKFGILSFNGNKIITTSGGGALVSNDGDLISTARFLSTQARDSAPHYQHSQIGYNYRMSNVVAGIGRGQMEVINDRIKKRREINSFYRKILKGNDAISFLTEPNSDYYSNHWLTSVIFDSKKCKLNTEEVRVFMGKENIECRPLWEPMHLQPKFNGYPCYLNGISEELFNHGLCLPSGTNITDVELDRVKNTLLKVFCK